MHEFLLASGNSHKADEFAELFDEKIIKVTAAPEKVEVVEDGETYFENALKKALTYHNFTKKPVLADDSGLNIPSLPGELGIYSARFGGEGLTDKERAMLLLEKMKEMQDLDDRLAYFTCVLCFYISESEIYYFEGRVHGRIGFSYVGTEGFGYDPVFIPTELEERGLSFAQAADWKQKNSHRAKACQMAESFFAQRV